MGMKWGAKWGGVQNWEVQNWDTHNSWQVSLTLSRLEWSL